MLVLSRKVGEQIVIKDDIEVTILQISGSRVKIGINAPKSVPVNRGEVCNYNQQTQSKLPPTLSSTDLRSAEKRD